MAEEKYGGGLVNLSWANKRSVRHTSVFKKLRGPFSDGGSYAIYECNHCGRTFYGGDGVRRLPAPDGERVVQCPGCGCVDPSWRKDFEKYKLVKPDST